MLRATRKNFIQYAVLPGFRQRFQELFTSGFQYIAYFIALVYGAVRLLPENHPYLQPSNMGRFGIRHVIAEAANNIVFSRHNIDQVLLFICILFGLALIAMQCILLVMGLVVQPAMAAMPTNFAGFFLTSASGNERQDIAHIMMDMVFGVPELFNSCISPPATACFDVQGSSIARAPGAPGGNWALEGATIPFPIHTGMHQLFQMYNTGLTVVAVFITIYFIITILAETAQSGTPFGKRFNKVWAPIRLVFAFGLLFPIGYGYNSAQYIVLYAAKFGSGFATNGWNIFNDSLSNAYGSSVENLLSSPDASPAGLISRPNIPEVGSLIQFLFTAKTCQEAIDLSGPDSAKRDPNVQPVYFYLVGDPFRAPQNHFQVTANTTYQELWNFSDGKGQVIIRFGQRDEAKYGRMMGFVQPTCGEIAFKFSDPRGPNALAGPGLSRAERGVEIMQRYYWHMLKDLWFSKLTSPGDHPQNFVNRYQAFDWSKGTPNSQVTGPLPDAAWRQELYDSTSRDLREAMTGDPDPNLGSSGILGLIGGGTGAINEMNSSLRWDVDINLRNKGWAGAAIWYNRIAEMNGGMTSAVLNIPLPTRYPLYMEKVYAEKRQGEQQVNFKERFKPQSTTGTAKGGLSPIKIQIAGVLWYAFDYWQQGDNATSTHTSPTGNAVVDIINALFGTEGLFSMRRNADVHPLAQITGVGRSLIEGSIRNLTYATIGGAGGALLSQLADSFSGKTLATASSLLVTFAMLGLTAGFILFYIVPFLPFIYFFFAVGGWVKGIFEAMVGAPLWALAHIRIDGNGLAGQAAVSGYFLIFEVFLRPILIVFGLLASMSIFSALVSVLHDVFDLVVVNTGGFDASYEYGGIGISKIAEMRSAVDEFFFTIIYTIIVYLIGMASFKLVDLIPNNILRWMGQSVATFGDQQEDMGQKLVGTSTIGAQQTLGSVGGGLQQIAGLGKK